MMQTPIREKTKAFCAIVAAITGASLIVFTAMASYYGSAVKDAITGASLIVFTAMASYYGSAVKDADARYREALRQLQLERSMTREDVKGIMIRLKSLEAVVLKAHPKE